MSNIKTAVILAAGRGSRLKELSLEHPKPMTQVHNTSIIENLVNHLVEAGLTHIVIVVGYLSGKLKEHLYTRFENKAELVFIENSIFDKTNNIYSLWLAADYLHNGFYLFEADVFFEKALLKRFLENPADDIILVDRYHPEMEGTVITKDEDDRVNGMYLKRHQKENFSFEGTYKTLNFYKISADLVESMFLRKLQAHIEKEDVNSYYELIIKEAIDEGVVFTGVSTEGLKWWEIDTYEDLVKAERIFSGKPSS